VIEIIFGAIIGAIISLSIAELYHRRSSRELESLINKLKDMLKSLEEWQEYHDEILQIIRKHVARGTPDDPEFPYK